MPIIDPMDSIVDPFGSGEIPPYEGPVDRPAPTMIDHRQVLEEEAKKLPWWKRGAIGTGQGMVEASRGIQQLYYKATGQPERAAEVTQAGNEDRMIVQPLGTAGKIGSFVGKTAPYSLIPGGVAGSLPMRMATGAAAGVAQGAGDFAANDTWGERGVNALLGGAGGAAGAGAMGVASKLVNWPRTELPADPYPNIPKTYSERTTGQTNKREVLMESAPSWMGGLFNWRKKQHNAAREEADKFMASYIANPRKPTVQGNRDFVDGLYDEVVQVVGTVPQYVQPIATKKAAQEVLDTFPEVFEKLQNQKLKRQVNDILEGVDATKTSKVPGFDGKPVFIEDSTKNFRDMWELRKALGDNLEFAKRELSRENYGKYKKLWGAVTDDLNNWANKIGRPDIMEKFKAANDAYKQYIVKHHTIKQVYDQVMNEVGPERLFSPQTFATKLNKIIQKNGDTELFSRAEVARMSGLANVMQVVKRAGQFRENPPTGNRWGAIATAGAAEGAMFKTGGMMAVAKGTAAAAATMGIIRFMTTTPMGQKLAFAASKVEPDSMAMRAIMNTIYRQAPKFAAAAATSAVKGNPLEQSILSSPSFEDITDEDLEKRLREKYAN